MKRRDKCLVLAQCDAHVTELLVQYEGVPVESMVEKVPAQQYSELLQTDSLYESFDQLLRTNYEDAIKANFTFKHDSFGGYGLFYVGRKSLKPGKPDQDIENVWAAIEQIDAENESKISPVSVFKPTEICRKSRIMIGAVRFANHSCSPNCRYQITEWKRRKCVKLQIVREILPGDEITVFYGDSYFGEGNCECLCVHSDEHEQSSSRELTNDSSQMIFLKPRSTLVDANIRSRYIQARRRFFRGNSNRKRLKLETEMRYFDSDSSDILSLSCNSPRNSSNVEEDGNFSQFSGGFLESENHEGDNASNHLISSPKEAFFDIDIPSELSLIGCELVPPTDSDDSKRDFETRNLNSATASNFSICVNSIAAEHGTSDAELAKWIKLVKIVSGREDLPSMKTLKKQYHLTNKQCNKMKKPSADREVFLLNFVDELHQIIQRNIKHINDYCMAKTAGSDLTIPQLFDLSSKTLHISLLLNSDGVKILRSSKKSIWPVWLAVANLPPGLRASFVNIVLASLWFGNNKPDWDCLFQVSICHALS